MSYLYGNLLNDVFRKWDSKGWHDFCPTDPLTFVSVDICAISTLVPPVMDGRQTDRLYENRGQLTKPMFGDESTIC
jgi:hypothetical protein